MSLFTKWQNAISFYFLFPQTVLYTIYYGWILIYKNIRKKYNYLSITQSINHWNKYVLSGFNLIVKYIKKKLNFILIVFNYNWRYIIQIL